MLNHGSSRPPGNSFFLLTTSSPTLADPITIKIGRRGVVGSSGRVINIGSDGAWSVARFINGQTESSSASGRLSAEQIRSIAQVLNDSHHGHTLASLPIQIGASHINCPIASISSGQISKLAYIEINSPKAPDSSAARAFSDIVSKLLRIIGA